MHEAHQSVKCIFLASYFILYDGCYLHLSLLMVAMYTNTNLVMLHSHRDPRYTTVIFLRHRTRCFFFSPFSYNSEENLIRMTIALDDYCARQSSSAIAGDVRTDFLRSIATFAARMAIFSHFAMLCNSSPSIYNPFLSENIADFSIKSPACNTGNGS